MGYDKQRGGFTEMYHTRLTTLILTRLENPEDYTGESGAARAKREEAEWEFVANAGAAAEAETEDEYNPPPRWEPWAAPGASIPGTVSVARGGRDYANIPPPGAGAPAPEEAPPGYF